MYRETKSSRKRQTSDREYKRIANTTGGGGGGGESVGEDREEREKENNKEEGPSRTGTGASCAFTV